MTLIEKNTLKRVFSIRMRAYRWWHKLISFFRLLAHRGKAIYLFGCPMHPNLGDQAQLICTEKWLTDNYPEYRVMKLNWNTSHKLNLALLKRKIRKNDLIFGHSGYFIVDHHPELPVYCKIAQMFPDNKITILPQTVFLKTEEKQREVAAAFNSHPDFTLLCRDEVSYETAQKVFQNCRLILFPDIVTSLIGTRKFAEPRTGIQFCIRNDSESFYSPDKIKQLRERLDKLHETSIMDTSIPARPSQIARYRHRFLEQMLHQFSSSKLVITDRYHGTIFSLVSGTPVIVLSSTDHKLSSGVKWFAGEFKDYIVFATDLEEAYSLAKKMLQRTYSYELPPYFRDQYYSKLKTLLEDA